MLPSKAIELMRIYLAEYWREMTPDDVAAHTQAIDALRMLEPGAIKYIAGLCNMLMGAVKRAKNMLIRGGDSIGCKTNES